MSGSFNATADSSATGIRFVAESAVGTTPATPTLREFEVTSESLNATRTPVVSQSFRTDRQVPGATTVSESYGGELGFELKFGANTDALIEAALQGTWSSNAVSNGVTRRSFTFEKVFGGIGQFQVYRGAEITSIGLSMTVGQIITGTIGVQARDYAEGTASVGATIVAAPITQFMNVVTDGFVLEVGGTPVSGILQSFEFNLDNNAREQRAIGSKRLAGMGMGRSNLTGTMQVFFNGTPNAIRTAYLNDQPASVSFLVPDPDGNAYRFTFHALKLLTSTTTAGAIDQDVLSEISFQGILGGANGRTITVERIPD